VSTTAPGAAGSSVTARLTVLRALAAARAGDLDEAARLLDGVAPGADAPTVLDLRARVHAQRGELAEADACWARVQELRPDDTGAAAGRRTIAEVRSGRRRPRPVLHPARTALAAAVAAVVLAGGAVVLVPPGEGSGTTTATGRTRQEAGRAESPERRLASLHAAREAAAAREDAALDEAARRLAMPGVRVERRAHDVRLLFEEGLFPEGTVLGPGAARLLGEVGRALRGLGVHTTVVGHSVLVPGGRPGGGSPMALARAQAAVDHLAAGARQPLTAFRLASGDQRSGPYRDAARNRTVSLVLAAGDAG
jgi:hypothetical protein